MSGEPASQSPPDTRARILNAARTVLAREGYAATTMRAIAGEAGVAVGLANYHFNSRRELLGEVIASSREYFLGVARARVPEAPGPERLRRVLEIVQGLATLMPDWYRLGADLDAQGLRDEELATAAAASKRRGQADVREYLELVCEAFEVPIPADVDGISAALLAAFDGLAVRSLLDPDFEMVPAYLALERLFVAAVAPAASPAAAAWDLDPYPEVEAPAGSEGPA